MALIPIDVDRTIKPSKAAGYEYEANAKSLSVYFNKLTPVRNDGVWICANPNPVDWFDHAAKSNAVFFDVPDGGKISVIKNVISYNYPIDGITIRISVGFENVRREIIVEKWITLKTLQKYLGNNYALSNLSITKAKTTELKLINALGVCELEIATKGIVDSSVPECSSACHNNPSGNHICTAGQDHNCGGCGGCEGSGEHKQFFPQGPESGLLRDAYEKEHEKCWNESFAQQHGSINVKTETITATEGKLNLVPSLTSLDDLVFPVTINDEITGWKQTSSITLSGKCNGSDTTGAVLFDNIGSKILNLACGGMCTGGNMAVIAASYDTDMITINFGSSVTPRTIMLFVGTANGTSVKCEYYDGSWHDYDGSYEQNGVGCGTFGWFIWDDFTAASCTQIRFNFKNSLSKSRLLVSEMVVYDNRPTLPEVTGWQSSGNITLAGKFDGGNSSAVLYDFSGNIVDLSTSKWANTGVGGSCSVGDTGSVGSSYDTSMITLDLGAVYTLKRIVTNLNMSNGFFKWQYQSGENWVDFRAESQVLGCHSDAISIIDIDDIPTRYIRLNVKSGQARCYVNEIQVYGEASGGSTISLWKSQRRKYQHLVVR